MSTTLPSPLTTWLFNLRGPSLRWDIETAQSFFAWLGHPHRAFRSVHVAGTNGKGSVAAMIHAVACACGLRSGLFTSPHLVTPCERIRIGDDDLSPGRFETLIAELKQAAAKALEVGALPRHPSFFEIMTAAAMLTFARERVDLAVFETGLGGRLDATNVLLPLVSIITTVSLDHTKTLGDSLTAIAREKGGIVKPGIPLLAGWMEEKPLAVLREIAHRAGAPFHDARQEIGLCDTDGGRFDVVTPAGRHAGLACPLQGAHQRRNAALAIRALDLIRARGVPIATGSLARGLANVRWPGRLERIGAAPEILLDAAHNTEGMRVLADFLAQAPPRQRRTRRILVFGLTDGREPRALLEPLEGLVDVVIVTEPETARAQPAADIAARLAGGPFEVTTCPASALALERAAAAAGAEGQVVVAGSLYLVGDVRRTLLGLEGPGHPARERVPDLSASPHR